jgi:hypothetical protein
MVLIAIWIAVAFLLPRTFAPYLDSLAAAGGVMFLAAPHFLRAEIRSLYRHTWGIDLPINQWLTIFFSSLYI